MMAQEYLNLGMQGLPTNTSAREQQCNARLSHLSCTSAFDSRLSHLGFLMPDCIVVSIMGD